MGEEIGSTENDFSKSPLNAKGKGSESAEAIRPEKGMWKSRTPLEKHLLATILLFGLVTAILLSAIILLVVLDTDKSLATENGTTVCSTEGCVLAAANFLNAMNTSVNPCENFYEFACGQWIDRHPIPDEKYEIDVLDVAAINVRQQMLVLLEQEVVSESKSINMAKAIYRSCANETQHDELKGGPLLESLTKLGEWPLLQENWDKTKFNLSNLFLTIRREFEGSIFFTLGPTADFKNSSRNTLYIDQAALGLGSRNPYLNPAQFSNQITAYRTYIRNIAQLLQTDGNLTRSEAEVNVDIDKIIAFETEIAKIMVAENERRNQTRLYNKREIRDLYSLFPQINWVPFIQSFLPADMAHLFHNGTEIIIKEIEYIRHVSDLIEKTDARILTNYVLWRIAQTNVKYLDKRFLDARQEFIKVMTGQQQRPSLKDTCYDFPFTHLPLAIGAIYVQAHFKQSDKEEASRMIANLMNAFVDMVRTNEWMDEATKAAAIEKVNEMIKFIGYPNITIDVPQLDKYYSGLSINESDTYYSVMKKIGVWKESRNFQELMKPVDKYDIDVSPATINAFHALQLNALILPAAILQPPMFSGSFPKAVNYGSIGAIIGHEVVHGFDDQGSQYDKHGNMRNWWSNSSLKEFDIRKRCIVEQYGNYTVPKTNHRVNGILTQGENIADNAGVKAAFKAYQKYVQENGEEPRLPGLQQYTNEQIFFFSYAQTWCEKQKEESILRQIQTDTHSPNLFRVIGVLSNMEEFANTFNCPPNSPFNPSHKCSVF